MFSAKPVIQQAFHAARRSGDPNQSGRSADYVEAKEFRTLLIALRQYYELYAMFNRLDTSDDRRIELAEFKKGLEFLEGWGVKIAAEDVEAQFASIDTNGGGQVLFDEFAPWAIQKSLDLEEDDDFDGKAVEGLDAAGYMAEKGGMALSNGIVTKEPQPRLCYTHMGAVVPLQTTAVAEVVPHQHSPNRLKRTVEMRPESTGGLRVLGGIPQRRMTPHSKFRPNHPIPPQGAPAGLPYALGQMLLAKAKEDYEESYPGAKPGALMAPASPPRLKDDGAAKAAAAAAAAAGNPNADLAVDALPEPAAELEPQPAAGESA